MLGHFKSFHYFKSFPKMFWDIRIVDSVFFVTLFTLGHLFEAQPAQLERDGVRSRMVGDGQGAVVCVTLEGEREKVATDFRYKLVNATGYLHYMTKSMCTPAYRTSHSKIMGIHFELVPRFFAITGSTLLGRLSTRCWNIAVWICFHSATRALVRLGTDGLQSAFQFIPKVFNGVEVRALFKPVKLFNKNLDKPFLY
jgi:hypothetical protein